LIELDEAYRLAFDHLVEHVDRRSRLMIVRAELRDAGWVFFYASKDFVESRSFLHALGGDRPILVDAQGVVTSVVDPKEMGELGGPIHPGLPN
jgi:hypothetical protein